MTTFEITIIVLLVAIVVLLAWHFLLTRNNYSLNQTKELKRQQDFERLLSKLQSILDVCNQQQNAWACDVTTIIKLLKELVGIEHKSDERNDNMFPFMQEIMRKYNPPCYSPNGICTNPQMDCINCPKRSAGGIWSTNTSIKAEDAPLQERFNNNKDD